MLNKRIGREYKNGKIYNKENRSGF